MSADSNYEGQLSGGCQKGLGASAFGDGTRHMGNYDKDEIKGLGFSMTQDKIFMGEFKESKFNGNGF